MKKIALLMKRIALAAVCIGVVFLIVRVISYVNRPVSPNVTVPEIQEAIAKKGPFSVKYQDSSYMVKSSDQLAESFAFDAWEPAEERSKGTLVMVFYLAEEWLVDLYSDGAVVAYDGYALSNQKTTARYTAPAEIVSVLSGYIETNGELQERHYEHMYHH